MRVAIVNDSVMATEVLRRSIALIPGYEIAWTAGDGREAVRRCVVDRPDLLLMDLMMPVMDGVHATRQIMRDTPCPILIVTGSIKTHTAHIFETLAAGALDVTRTPAGSLPDGSAELRKKIAVLEKLTRGTSRHEPASPPTRLIARNGTRPLVAIGASAGGPAALAALLSSLPADFAAPIVIVQHIDAQFTDGLVNWLRPQSTIPVRVVREGERPEPNVALIAATDDHLIMLSDESLSYTVEPRGASYRPSVDVFFETAALHWRGRTIGVVLTGMGRDGVGGLRAVQDAGGITLAQNRATSIVYGMPKAAAEAGVVDEVLPLDEIGRRIAAVLAGK